MVAAWLRELLEQFHKTCASPLPLPPFFLTAELPDSTSLFDDTLVYVDYDGSLMNKAQYLRTVADPTAKPEHMHDEGMKVHV
ncbi:MAG TPA: hypothetical protein VN879_14285, partial [Candidatus Acidoferrales bacterium]|nr:hypothetical protein [Candidatus Acidoferrales bacterium]